jgi:hypothetical protein
MTTSKPVNNPIAIPSAHPAVLEYLTFETFGEDEGRFDVLRLHQSADGYASEASVRIDETKVLAALAQTFRGNHHDDAQRSPLDEILATVTGGETTCLGSLRLTSKTRTHTHLLEYGERLMFGVMAEGGSDPIFMITIGIKAGRELADQIDQSI